MQANTSILRMSHMLQAGVDDCTCHRHIWILQQLLTSQIRLKDPKRSGASAAVKPSCIIWTRSTKVTFASQCKMHICTDHLQERHTTCAYSTSVTVRHGMYVSSHKATQCLLHLSVLLRHTVSYCMHIAVLQSLLHFSLRMHEGTAAPPTAGDNCVTSPWQQSVGSLQLA